MLTPPPLPLSDLIEPALVGAAISWFAFCLVAIPLYVVLMRIRGK